MCVSPPFPSRLWLYPGCNKQSFLSPPQPFCVPQFLPSSHLATFIKASRTTCPVQMDVPFSPHPASLPVSVSMWLRGVGEDHPRRAMRASWTSRHSQDCAYWGKAQNNHEIGLQQWITGLREQSKQMEKVLLHVRFSQHLHQAQPEICGWELLQKGKSTFS